MFHQYKFGEVKTAHIDINSGGDLHIESLQD